MKQAEHCGRGSTPTLNQTGLLKAIFWCSSRCVSSALKVARSSSLAKVRCVAPQAAMVSTTRSMSCLTLCSRCGEPMWPRKYLLTTTFVASWLQKVGTSTSACSKTALPDSLEMLAWRISHVTSS